MSKRTPHFQLSAAQGRLLIAKERASFIRHCEDHGWTTKAREEVLYEYYMQRSRDIAEGLHQRGGDPGKISEILESLAGHRDYWQFLRSMTAAKRRQLADEIGAVASDLPIDYAYVSRLAKKMALPAPSEDDPESLADFLDNVPFMNLFELEFNAFVAGESTIDGIPCLCFYALLPGAVDFFVNLFLSALAGGGAEGSGSNVTIPRVHRLYEKASKPEFVASCQSGFLCLLGITADATMASSCYFANTHTELVIELTEALVGSSYFVGFHEFGHLLLGHLEKPYSPSLEHEADAFAARIVVTRAVSSQAVPWRALGMAILFNILVMVEILDPPEAQTHPPATARLAKLNDEFPDIDLALFASTVMRLWEPAYKKFRNPQETDG